MIRTNLPATVLAAALAASVLAVPAPAAYAQAVPAAIAPHAVTTGSGTPFQQSVTCTIADGSDQGVCFFSVPRNHVLVIQTVSVNRYNSVTGTAGFALNAAFKNASNGFILLPADAGPLAGSLTALTAYADSSNSSSLVARRSGTTGVENDAFTVTGYTVPQS